MPTPIAYDVAHLEKDVKGFADYSRVYEYLFSDLVADVIRFPIPNNRAVICVRLHVLTAFDGGTPTVSAGDAASATGWILTTDIVITTLNEYVNSLALANAYCNGKFYLAGGVLLLTHATGSTDGKMRVEIKFDGYDSDAPKDMIRNY